MVKAFLFKDRDGQTPLPPELQKGLKLKHIQTIGELDEYEEENILEVLLWLQKSKAHPCDYLFWLKLHKRLFGNVWSWAGRVRTHELANADFADSAQIWTELSKLEGDVRYWVENGTFSGPEIAAMFHERFQTIHPFANGNGCSGRILTEHLCAKSNIDLPTWGASLLSSPQKRRQAYIDALTKARRLGDYADLVTFMYS